jgi:hypothetical protein
MQTDIAVLSAFFMRIMRKFATGSIRKIYMDKWYFALTDNRRVGQDFPLTKGEKDRMTLTRHELLHRLGSGGLLMDRQSEYIEYVNQQIFGFETVGEYKEMIYLLIQLRTPKLSKDFKPSVINEILSESLQPTSDEDLRLMSEAIENMDTMNMNLKARQEGKQAAERIARVFDKYNQLFLYEKASRLTAGKQKLEEINKQSIACKQQTFQCEIRIREARDEHEALRMKREAMEQERDSLSSSNALTIQRQIMEITDQIRENEVSLGEKEKQLSHKLERQTQNRLKEKQSKDEIWEKQQELLERTAAAGSELREWEQNKQPEPWRSPEVISSRRKLRELGIAYQEFYQLVEFAPDMKEEECSRLEEDLLQMGVLDALLVEDGDRERIRSLDPGMCDRYLFRQKGRVQKSLMNLFH